MPKDDSPRVIVVVLRYWSMHPCCGDSRRCSEGVWNILVDCNVMVGVCSYEVGVNWGIRGRYMSHDEISMSMEQCARETLSEVIRHIEFCVNSFQKHQVTVNPITERKIFYIHVSSSRCWFLRITHCCTGIIVFIQNGGRLLGNPEVP